MKKYKYRTYMICSLQDAERIDRLRPTNLIRFSTELDPSKRHSGNFRGDRSTILHRTAIVPLAPGYQYLPHLEIWAPNKKTAELAQRLVYLGALLGTSNLIEMPNPIQITPASEVSHNKLSKFPWWDIFKYYDTLSWGCVTCLDSIENTSHIYALEKHYLSLRLDSFTPHSASPIFGLLFSETYPEHAYHVSAAYSIIAAFSIIEELGLEVRASQQRPRFISGTTTWNPKVLSELNNRLQSVGLNAEEEFVWVARGKKTNLRSSMQLDERDSAWSRKWRDVADRKITLADAIQYSGWLRNKVSAHRFSDMTSEIGPYEVHNCQRLARYLLIASLGLLPLIQNWENQ